MTGDENTPIVEGRTVGAYVLRSLLGRGGMGEVWRATDTVRERDVALKLISGTASRDPELAARFRRECRLAAKLSSAHVVPIHDFGEIDDRLFLDMRLVPGPDLRTVLDRHPEGLDPAAARDVITQVADALDSAHERELVHRDVKPSNVLVDNSRGRWFCYLADFGVAVPLDSGRDTRITRTGTTVGTPPYMAPELLSGDGRASVATDVYALGCLLHELLTGRAPFTGPNDASVLFQHVHTEPPGPSTHRPWLAGFDPVVRTAMAKDPARRFATAGDLARALPPIPPPSVPPDVPPNTLLSSDPPGTGRVRRRRGLLAVLSVVLLLGVAAGGYALARANGLLGETVPEAVAVRELHPFSGVTNGVSSSPDGRTALVVASDEQGRALFTLDGVTGQILSRTTVDGKSVKVVPNADGSRAYLTVAGSNDNPGQTVQVVDPVGRRVVADVVVGESPAFVAISPDGSRVYATVRPRDDKKAGSVAVIDTTRNIVVANVGVGMAPAGVAVSPDGKRVYVANYGVGPSGPGTVSVLDTATNRIERTVPTGPDPYAVAVAPDNRTLYVTTNSNAQAGTIDVFDTGSFARTEIPAPTSVVTADAALSVDGTRFVVINYGTDEKPGSTVTILNLETGTAFPVAQIGGRPRGVSLTPDGHHGFVVTSGDSGRVWAIEFP